MKKKILRKNKIKWLENKKYQHFGLPTRTYIDIKDNDKFCHENLINIQRVENIVKNPKKIARHQFYPLISTKILERKFGKHKQVMYDLETRNHKIPTADPTERRKLLEEITEIEKNFKKQLSKERPIKYASHLDAHIYAYYASEILLPKYESQIQCNDLDDEILAYRTVPDTSGPEQHHRSNNITMAKEVFLQILARDCNCIAMAYDLKSFFDTIDHKVLKEQWCKVLEADKLPPDHYNIYKSLTKYCHVDIKTVCKYFNFSEKCTSKEPNDWVGDCSKCRKPKRLPYILFKSASDFRKFRSECPAGAFQKNEGLHDKEHPYGIPQGTALSSVLSNIYLLDFDMKMKIFLNIRKAVYRRYCDDILIICAKEDQEIINSYILDEITKAGKYLKIHPIEKGNKYSKSQVYDFTDKEKIKQFPLQYLGFCFDGKSVEIRGSSLNRYWRKAHDGIIASKCNTLKKLEKMHDKRIPFQKKHEKMYRKKIYQRYTYVGRNNFLTYVKRAFNGMDGIDNRKINSQIKGHLKKVKNELEDQDLEIIEKIIELGNKET